VSPLTATETAKESMLSPSDGISVAASWSLPDQPPAGSTNTWTMPGTVLPTMPLVDPTTMVSPLIAADWPSWSNGVAFDAVSFASDSSATARPEVACALRTTDATSSSDPPRRLEAGRETICDMAHSAGWRDAWRHCGTALTAGQPPTRDHGTPYPRAAGGAQAAQGAPASVARSRST
jgi:hypothetical protein